MTAMIESLTGASFDQSRDWDNIDWLKVTNEVKRMQMRIAKAIRENRYGKVKSLQRLLSSSFYAKLLAVKRVTENRGSKTPGVDGVTWKTPKQKIIATLDLSKKGYKTLPLRRIYIPKRNGKKRPLSIPSIKCRAMQALYLLGLEPIAEMWADPNSYGFRPKRSTADAIEQCFKVLVKGYSPQWILEGDIKSCFDKIKHDWLENRIPMDKQILKKWLKAGYIEKDSFYETKEGTPQGGIISPCILTMTLKGLEAAVKKAARRSDKVNIVVYADDFIVTGATKEVLEQKIKPIIASFLRERGLDLSHEKTKVTHIQEGFDFLGFNVRKYNGKLLIKPSAERIKDFLSSNLSLIKRNKTVKTANLIRLLNPKLQGWANYYRHVCSKKTFQRIDHTIFKGLWNWAKRRHPKKGLRWVKDKYFRTHLNDQWMLFDQVTDKKGKSKILHIFKTRMLPIRRHTKIRAEANPYDLKYKDYFNQRDARNRKVGSG